MKKSLALLLTIILCVSIFSGISVSAFPDVPENHRHVEAITYLTGKRVINGYEDGTFRPENTITRAEFLKMLLEFLGFTNIYGETLVKTGFDDVDAKVVPEIITKEDGTQETVNTYINQHWAAGYIKLAVTKGVVNGYGNGTFLPDAPVKYEEAIKMIVCCLGYEDQARQRAQSEGIPLWPDGYLSIGKDFGIAELTDYELGTDASRSNIAQMLYNIKDVKVYVAPNISIGGGEGGVTIGGGGNSEDVESSTQLVSGLLTYGQIVTAAKPIGNTNRILSIDSNAPTTSNKYITLKLETPIDGNDYMSFYTAGTDYSHYLGYRVELRYAFNPDGGVNGRYEVEAIGPKDTYTLSVNSSQFKAEKTAQKNLSETNVHICYTDGNEDFYQSFYTPDLNTLKVIYNNKVIDVEELRDEYIASNQPFEGVRDDIDIITLNDLMPKNGNIKIIDADDDTEIDLVWVNSYETYVVGARSFNTNPKKITDKFRTEENGVTPLTLVLNDADPNVSLTITKGGQEKEVTDIAVNNVLTVAKSKCGKNVDITIETTTSLTNGYESSKTQNGVKTGLNMANGKTYVLSDYFKEFVDATLEYEAGDSMTLYLNSNNEVVWAKVAEVAYSTGYLIQATYSETTEKLSLDILSSGGTIARYTMEDSRTRYITKAYSCLSSVTPDSMTNPNGNLYKNLSPQLILQSLQENAAIINADKSSTITTNATTAQPIMYTVASGNTLSHLITLEPDTEYKYTDTSRKYDYTNGVHKFSTDVNSFGATASSMIIFVPNDRFTSDMSAKAYKIGTVGSLASSKLVKNMPYNIEPFFTTDSAGNQTRTVFVVYNESIDREPNYRSENIIVSSIEGTLSGSSTVYTLKGHVASNTSTKTYTTYTQAVYEQAYVLDENFARTGEKRAIEVGDIVRVGYGPTGNVACAEIILDISEAHKSTAPKVTAISKRGATLDTSNPDFGDLVHYYARVGEVTSIDSATTPEWCNITLPGDNVHNIYIGSGYSSRQILMYDYTGEDLPATDNKDERLKTATMGDLWGGEMLYIWQGEDLAIKQIYAVRYPAPQP